MGPSERRMKLLETLNLRRYDTYDNLANEFNVSPMTIRRDISNLMCSYPVETVRGHHGGVKMADGFYLRHINFNKQFLNSEQIALLESLRTQVDGKDLEILNSILLQFAPQHS